MKIRVVQTDHEEFTVKSTFYEDTPFYVDIKKFSTEEEARKFAEELVKYGDFKEKVIEEYEI